MELTRSPFLKIDKSTATGYLKAAGSRDPDVLHARKAELLSLAKFPKLAGIYMMVMGALATILILTAVIGIPMLGLGWWMLRRGKANLDAVEAAYAEFTGTVRAA